MNRTTLTNHPLIVLMLAGWLAYPAALRAGDWPQWGRTPARNMVSPERGLPDLRPPAGETATRLTDDNCPYVKWKVALDIGAWGNPTVADGRLYIGTAGPDRKGGAIRCFDSATGKPLWNLECPPRDFPTTLRPADYEKYSPWDWLVPTHAQQHGWGVCSSTTVDGERAYGLTQAGEIVCLGIKGRANGGAAASSDTGGVAAADVVWSYDLWNEVLSRPADTFSNAALIDGDLLYISSCNGIERWPKWYGKPAAPPSPNAPNLVVLNKRTGRLVATDDAPISRRMLHGQWSPPAMGIVDGRKLIFYGGGDGVCYAFEALKEVPSSPVKLKTVWSYDCNPPEYRGIGADNYSLGDKDVVNDTGERRESLVAERAQHFDREGRLLSMSEIIASPVFHNNRVYVAIGRDPRHGPGRGALHCIDATRTGDISQSGRIWCYDAIDRTLSTASVADGLVYIADVTGCLYCLDADTGGCYWTHKTTHETWGSTLVADGRVYLVTRKSFWVLAAGKQQQELSMLRIGAECSPIAANQAIYVFLRGTLYALHQPGANK